jgi:Ring hydroxylating alpha subunit (catalytic domain)
MGGRAGIDYSEKSDSEMLDVIQYQVFPNLMPWAGCSFPLSYRFRPAETPDSCWFDVMILAPLPDGVEMPRDVPPTVVPPDEPFAAAEQLGALGPVYDQDMVNIPRVQIGLHNDSFTHVTMAGYQEGNIRHFHRRLEEFLDR